MLHQQITMFKISVPIISFMFILCTVDYLSRFGFTSDLPTDGCDTIQKMVGLLVRITCSFSCVLCGSIAIFKQYMLHVSVFLVILASISVCRQSTSTFFHNLKKLMSWLCSRQEYKWKFFHSGLLTLLMFSSLFKAQSGFTWSQCLYQCLWQWMFYAPY
jgi:hypothetical protein